MIVRNGSKADIHSARPSQHQIERPIAPVAGVRLPYGGYGIAVRASGEPVEHLGPDRAAPLPSVGGFHRARLAGDHQHQPRAERAGLG